jgi:hypothetical protein
MCELECVYNNCVVVCDIPDMAIGCLPLGRWVQNSWCALLCRLFKLACLCRAGRRRPEGGFGFGLAAPPLLLNTRPTPHTKSQPSNAALLAPAACAGLTHGTHLATAPDPLGGACTCHACGVGGGGPGVCPNQLAVCWFAKYQAQTGSY